MAFLRHFHCRLEKMPKKLILDSSLSEGRNSFGVLGPLLGKNTL